MSENFDKHANNYDAVFTYSEIGKAQRSRVYHFLNKHLLSEKNLSILELNCGTGEDANYLSKLGHTVLATDISSEMINVARAKHQHKNLKFQELDITKITSETFTEKFDLIFSNFGGFNCLSKNEIANFFSVSENLLNPLGKIALVIMPKHCLLEQFYFSIKGDFKKAKRRNTNEFVYANVEGVQVPTWYYNPEELVSLASNNYKTIVTKPIGIAIPPSYLEPFFRNKKWWLNLLIWKEKWLSNSFWAKYADHFLIIFQKT
ncbi:MAG: methyltransferase domain-containing protein [Flavobacteriaceae bacterium]|nr:methyltransferase domain-containing protein [Flavobacteriaceae bacterium]